MTTEDVARIAREVGEAGDAGKQQMVIGGQTFDLKATGWCTRFVRQCHEAALGISPMAWEFRAPNAKALEQRLKAEHLIAHRPVAGDIVCINRNAGVFGHVGILLDNGWFAENTSSSRGPGTTISKISQVASRISGYYRVLATDGLKIILLPGSAVIDCNPVIENGVTRCDLRPIAETLGYDVITDHLQEQNKIYLRGDV